MPRDQVRPSRLQIRHLVCSHTPCRSIQLDVYGGWCQRAVCLAQEWVIRQAIPSRWEQSASYQHMVLASSGSWSRHHDIIYVNHNLYVCVVCVCCVCVFCVYAWVPVPLVTCLDNLSDQTCQTRHTNVHFLPAPRHTRPSVRPGGASVSGRLQRKPKKAERCEWLHCFQHRAYQRKLCKKHN